MRIGIDATVVATARIVGISRFVVNLVSEYARRSDAHTYDLYYRPRALHHPSRIWRPQDPRFRVRLLQEPFHRRRFKELDVFHATYQRLPRSELVPYVGSLHDIYYLSQSTIGSARTRALEQARYRDVAVRSRVIMTLSEFSKREIVRLLGIDAARVRVVPLAADPAYVPQSADVVTRVRQRYGLGRPYVLFGGGWGRRKNAAGALRAFALALSRLPGELDLAISGGGGPMEAEAQRVIREAGVAARVKILGFVPDSDHAALMTGSVCYFFPSLLEGFGLPALEAMACGAPVVASSTTSLPEVCGEAARLVDPTDDRAMADALVDVTTQDALRETMRLAGLARASEFSWSAAARATLALCRDAAASGAR